MWGHDTGVAETARDFNGHWYGTGTIANPGVADTECLELEAGEWMISEVVDTGATTVTLQLNKYAAGDAVTIEYRHGATEVACLSAVWNAYAAPFASLGFVQIRLTSTL